MSRERRPNGNDTCEKGHVYPSSAAQASPTICLTKQPPLHEQPQIVMSVRHSGTQTLVDWLDIRGDKFGLPGGKWWHFGECEELLEKHLEKNLVVHIPMRNPYDVAFSWARRGANLDDMFRAYDAMFKWVHLIPQAQRKSYKVEDIPHRIGENLSSHQLSHADRHAILEVMRHRVVEPHRHVFASLGYVAR